MDLYAENILDHYRHPRNTGTLHYATSHRREENASCGDDLTVHVLIDHDRIRDLKWQGTGCAISQAAMSLLSEKVMGMTTAEVLKLSPQFVLELLGVPIGPRRLKCALLGVFAVQNALLEHAGLPEQSWHAMDIRA